MDLQKIKELALANGFKLKEQADGSMDLNAYVYDFANAIEQAAKAHEAKKIEGCVVDIQKEREAFDEWHYNQYLLENPNIDISNAKYIYDYAHKNVLVCQLRESHFTAWQAAKAQAVPEGFVLMPMVPSERMINAVRQCYEGEAFLPYSLYDAYVKQAMIEAQEPSNNVTPELVNNAVTYVIELQGYEAIEYARATLNKKGYKTWDYTDKDSIDDTDIYVLCVCPSTPNDSALVKGTFKGIHQGKFTYIQSDLESCPDAQEPAND